jgi:dTDP-4-amino-4,6-dideoxygalactose transaminase
LTTIQGGIAATNNDEIGARLQEFWDKADYPDEDFVDKILHNVMICYYSYKDPDRWHKRKEILEKYGDKFLVSTTREETSGIKPAHYGRKMPSAMAAIGMNQLKKVDTYIEERRETVKRWDRWCDANGYKRPLIIPDSKPVYLRYPVMVELFKKRDTSWAFWEMNLLLGVWFVSHIHPSDFPVKGCPNADRAVNQCINFPSLL